MAHQRCLPVTRTGSGGGGKPLVPTCKEQPIIAELASQIWVLDQKPNRLQILNTAHTYRINYRQ